MYGTARGLIRNIQFQIQVRYFRRRKEQSEYKSQRYSVSPHLTLVPDRASQKDS